MLTKLTLKQWWWSLWLVIVVIAAGLRLFHLSSTPPSPYWEEVALGYDAFVLLQTGRDHHGQVWPLVAFESFGDWKPTGYYYALLPFIATMGLSVATVRLPAALAGVLIVIGVGWVARIMGEWLNLGKASKSGSVFSLAEKWQLVAMAVTALSPWAIIFSRAAWEVNLATCLVVWGVGTGWAAWLQAQNAPRGRWSIGWLVLSAILFVLAMYTYHAARVVAPALGLGIGLGWLALTVKHHSWVVTLKRAAVAVLPAVLLVAPLVLALGSPVTSQRFAETSIFSDITGIERSNELQAMAGHSWWSRLAYHRYVLFGQVILQNFFAHFTPQFLFLTGDVNPRHSVQFLGQLYPFEVLFLLMGAVWLVTRGGRRLWLLWWWLGIGILPAAITLAAPHALRILLVMPVFMLVISAGLLQLVSWWQRQAQQWSKLPVVRYALSLVLILIYGVGLGIFWRFYTLVYTKQYSAEWQFGYQEMVQKVSAFRAENPTVPIYITREQGRPAMYYWFFTQADPKVVQAATAVAKKDQGEVLEYENLTFIRTVGEVTSPGLVVSSVEQAELLAGKDTATEVGVVQDQRGKPIWLLTLLE